MGTGSCQLGQSTPHLQISGNLNIFKAAMLLFLFLLVAGQASAEGGGRVLEIKNSKGETFSYKDRVAQEKEVFDIKDRSTQRKPWPLAQCLLVVRRWNQRSLTTTSLQQGFLESGSSISPSQISSRRVKTTRVK